VPSARLAAGALGALDQALGVGDARRPARRRDQPSSITSNSGPRPEARSDLRIQERLGDREDQGKS
jgi:hypothetical protein